MAGYIFKKPFRYVSLTGILYIMVSIFLTLGSDFLYKGSIYPFPFIVSISAQGIILVLFVLSFFFYNKHMFYFVGLELLVFADIYTNNMYTSIFFSSILLVFLLIENKIFPRKNIIAYTVIEIIKVLLVIPYGLQQFLYYSGLTLFAHCTIGCLNLLFRHAYDKKDFSSIPLDEFNLTERQINCIKEIVLNNITIKALAMNHKVSESAIKKDLTHIYKVFGISGKADLKALFIDFEFPD